MKLSRETSVFLTFALIVATLSGHIGAWFKLMGWVIGFVVLGTIFARMLKQLVSPQSKINNEIGKFQDSIQGIKTVSISNVGNELPIQTVKSIQKIHNDSNGGSITKKELDFAKKINAIGPLANRLPDGLVHSVALKTMYELERKTGSLRFAGKIPVITDDDISRPLEEDEIHKFHEFCGRQLIDFGKS